MQKDLMLKRSQLKIQRFSESLRRYVTSNKKIRENVEWLNQQWGYEGNRESIPSLWRIRRFDYKANDIEDFIHLTDPILHYLKQGAQFDYELSLKLDKPLFMIQHGLKRLENMEEPCPYELRGQKCIEVKEAYIEEIPSEEYSKYEENSVEFYGLLYGCDIREGEIILPNARKMKKVKGKYEIMGISKTKHEAKQLLAQFWNEYVDVRSH